jgi:cell division transport system permease protein
VFYLHKDRPAGERDLVVEQIKRSPLVGSVRLVSPENASAKFMADFPELRDVVLNLEANPFPPAVEVAFKDPALPTASITSFIAEVRKNAAVEDAQFNRDWAERVRTLGRLAEGVGLFLGGILILASFVIVSNVIKLIVMARRSEIEILRFVGATNFFIRIPFLLEGILLGFVASLVSLLVVFLLIKLFPIVAGPSLGAFREILGFRYLTWSQAGALILGGGVVGFIGSLSSLSRFLKS